MAGQVCLLVDDDRQRQEGHTGTDECTAMSMKKGLNVKRAHQGATVTASRTGVGQVRDARDVFTHRKNQTVDER